MLIYLLSEISWQKTAIFLLILTGALTACTNYVPVDLVWVNPQEIYIIQMPVPPANLLDTSSPSIVSVPLHKS